MDDMDDMDDPGEFWDDPMPDADAVNLPEDGQWDGFEPSHDPTHHAELVDESLISFDDPLAGKGSLNVDEQRGECLTSRKPEK